MSQYLQYLMTNHEHRKFIALNTLLIDKACSFIEAAVGERPPMSVNERRVFRVASILVIETATDEIERQCKYLVARVLTRTQVKDANRVIAQMVMTVAPLFINVLDDKDSPSSSLLNIMQRVVKTLKLTDDLIETGAWYQGELGNHKYFSTENQEAREKLSLLVKAVKSNKERLQQVDPALAHELVLLAARVGQEIVSAKNVDNFTSLDDVELER